MIGKTISHYKIVEELGEGGMGMVYKAEDTKLKRTVALKFLSPNYVGTTEEKARFIREAQTAAALDHPNICTIYEIDEVNDQLFISMAYIEGVTLKDKIQTGQLPLQEVIHFVLEIAQGLEAAHNKGIVHRDIKSANIMVTPKGQVTITDFGLAKLHGGTKVTKTGMTVGTVAYMSPEQARGESMDKRTDVWSLGVVIYEILTGQLPFKGDYEQAVTYNIVNQPPEPVTSLRVEVPKELARIIHRCLEKKPSDRFQHVGDLIEELGKVKKLLSAGPRENQGESLAHTVAAIDAQSHAPRRESKDSIPGYTIVRKLSEGGQGVVYQAVQESTKRKVAIKMMREGAFAGRSAKARFEREVQVLARLQHPSIVAIHDSGTAAGGHYFVMDYIAGRPLDEYMQSPDAPKSIKETLQLFETICSAVNAAHLAGIIHRDLKPSNVRIDNEGKPFILDFGLAKVALGDSDVSMMTMTGQFLGSLQWASPEQAVGMPDRIDMRTDVYSLGVVLYQMLTGEFPYQVTGSMHEVLNQIIKTEPRRASTLRRDVNDEVDTIVFKCLNKDRDRRYQSAGELARDIKHFLTGQPIEAKRDSFGYLMRKQLVRHKVPVAVGLGFVAVILIALVTSLTLWRRAVAERENTRFHLETARAEVAKSFEEYQAIIPQLRRAEDLAALLPGEVHQRYPEGSPEASYREATEWITGLFPSTPDSIPVTGYATLNSQTREAVNSCARYPYQPRDSVAVVWLRANQQGIHRLVESTMQHRFKLSSSSEGGLLIQNLLPALTDVRFGAAALTASALGHHDEGNNEMAIEELDAAERISRYAGDSATLVSRLVEIACRNIVHSAYRWMVADAVTKGSLPAAYKDFLTKAPPLPDYEHGYVSEVRALRQTLNEAFVKTSDKSSARLDLARLRALAIEWGIEVNPYANPSEAMIEDAKTLEYEQAISIITELCDQLRVQQNASFLEITAEGERVEKLLRDKHPVLIPLMPRFTRALELLREARMNRDATVIAVAIYTFRYTNDRWPKSIDNSLASFDPAPFGRDYYGHDFVYRIEDDAPLLYAIGPNGIDDGGQGRRYESRVNTGTTGDDVLFLAPESE